MGGGGTFVGVTEPENEGLHPCESLLKLEIDGEFEGSREGYWFATSTKIPEDNR